MSTATLAPSHLRKILAHVPTSITFIAGLDDQDQPVGMIIGSFLGLSLDPPLIGISIQHSSNTWPRLRNLEHLGISILTQEHTASVSALAGPSSHRFDAVEWSARGTAIHLAHTTADFTVRLREEITTGDHVFAVFEVIGAVENPAGSPLVFHGSTIKGLEGAA